MLFPSSMLFHASGMKSFKAAGIWPGAPSAQLLSYKETWFTAFTIILATFTIPDQEIMLKDLQIALWILIFLNSSKTLASISDGESINLKAYNRFTAYAK